METSVCKHHHIPLDTPPPLLGRKLARQLMVVSDNPIPMFESLVFCPADWTTTPKGKGHQLPPMPYTSPPPPSKQHRMEVGLFCVVPPVFSPANRSSTPKGNGHEIPPISDMPPSLPKRQPTRAYKKRVLAQNHDSPTTRPRYMYWSFCKSNDTRPLHTLPFFTEMAPRYFRWNGEDVPLLLSFDCLLLISIIFVSLFNQFLGKKDPLFIFQMMYSTCFVRLRCH